MQELKPKDGHQVVVLLAGGPPDRAAILAAHLATHGVRVAYHWEWTKTGKREWQRPIPRDVDLVVGVKTMMGVVDGDVLRHSANRAGVRVVFVSHKWSHAAATFLGVLRPPRA